MGSVDRGDPSRTPSIYRNPFEVPKDLLIRQLFEFSARIATFVQSKQSEGNVSGEVVESPFVVLAAKLKARDEAEARNLVSSEKMSGSIETLVKQQPLRNPLGGVGSQIRIEPKDELEARNLVASEQVIAAIDTFVEQQPLQNHLSEGVDWSRPTIQEMRDGALKTRVVVTSDPITYKRRKRKVVDQSGVSGEAKRVAAEELIPPTLPAFTNSLNQQDVTRLIIQVIRTLRHTKHGDTEKLFELLSIEHFPMDKCRFLEELIQQAYCYKKDWVAKRLAQHRSEICQVHPQERK